DAQSTACVRYEAPVRNASARSSPTTDETPRGQNRTPTTRLTAQPIATSSMRSTPTFQPTGASRLNSTAMVTVNAACPTANGAVPGVYAATNTAIGSTTHNTVKLLPIASSRAPPITKPIAVPPRARAALEPVDAAFVRSTESVPRTTQKPCWTLLTSATATATAKATAPLMLFTNQTERTLAWRSASAVTLDRRCAVREPASDPTYQRRRCSAIQLGALSRAATSASAPMPSAATEMVWA